MGSRLAETFKALLAAAGAAAAVAGPPVALVRFVGNPLPKDFPTWREFTDGIARGGIADATVVGILAVLAWVIWAQLAMAILVEATAIVRGAPSPRLPLLPGVQSLAAHWLAAAALIASPLAAGGSSGGHPPPVALAVAVDDAPLAVPSPSEPQDASTPPQPEPPRPVEPRAEHIVERHDSLWDIAERYLGDPFRWREIRDLNVGMTQPDGHTLQPGFESIQPGWRLLVPVPASGVGTTSVAHTVRPGDHLWGIAEHAVEANLGRLATDDEVRPYWQKLVDENRSRLIDPNDPGLIRPGQLLSLPEIDLPGDRRVPLVEDEPPAQAKPDPAGAHQEQEPSATSATTSTTTSAPNTSAPSTSQPSRSNGDSAIEKTPDSERLPVGPMLGVAGAALSTGVLAAIRRRQRQTSLRAPHGHGAPPLPEELDEIRSELVLRSDEPGEHDVQGALAAAGAHLARSAPLRRRRPVLVQVNDERIEVLLDQPALPAPAGWQPQASGAVWTCSRPVPEQQAQSPSPALVSVGAEGGVRFMLDLEALGVVTVGGDETDVDAFGRSMLLELAHKASGDAIALVLVGDIDLDEGPGVRRCASWEEIEQDVRAWARQSRNVLEAHRLPNVFAARSAAKQLDGLAPLVVVCDSLPTSQGWDAVRDLARDGAAVSVVVLGVEPADGPHIRIEDGVLSLEAIALRCRAQGVGPGADRAIEALLEAADRPPEQLAVFEDPDVVDLREDDYVDPPHDVLVGVLGEITVVGGNRALTPKETALFTFVALHDGCSVDRLEEAVWPMPMESRRRQVHNIASQVRSALGVEHLPASTDSCYSVGPKVRTDLDLLALRVTYASSQPPMRAIETLRGALELVNAPSFGYRHADRGSYTWVDLEHWSVTTEAKVVEAAWRLWELCQGEGDHDGAIWAARQGLLAAPGNAELTEALMRTYVAAGDRDAAEDVFASHAKALDQLDQDEPAASTLELWDEITSSKTDVDSR